MARSTPLALSGLLGALSLLCSVAPADAAPRKAELLRTWELEGSDSVGDYTGTLAVTNGGSRKVDLSAELTYADGSQRQWSSTGYYVFGSIYCRHTLPAGMAGHLTGAGGGDEIRGVLRPNQLATHLVSRYRSDAGFEGTETAFREDQAGYGFRWTPNTLARVLADNGLASDREDALLLAAAPHDDGNGFLRRSELEAGAADLFTPHVEIGIVSDIDKTVLPPHADGDPLPAPYPGVATLYAELEGPTAGDLTYVTARTAAMVTDIPAWMADYDVPPGPIETGVNIWTSQAEKVRDITRTLEATPGQPFVFFGDSSHRDPEVYREIMTGPYASRVVAVFIHKVTNTLSPSRVAGMTVLTNYAEAAAKLLELEVLDEDAARRVMEAAQAEGLAITDAEIETLLLGN